MVIATAATQEQWEVTGVAQKVGDWIAQNQSPLPTIDACATGTGLSFPQVAWALVFLAAGKTFPATILPENDAEVAWTSQIMSDWL